MEGCARGPDPRAQLYRAATDGDIDGLLLSTASPQHYTALINGVPVAEVHAASPHSEQPHEMLMALHVAVRCGREAAVTALLSAGADVNVRSTGRRRTPLMLARGHISEVLLRAGADACAEATDGSTALHAACMRADIVAIRALLASGARVNSVDAGGWAPLCCAAAATHTDATMAVEILVNAGADLVVQPCDERKDKDTTHGSSEDDEDGWLKRPLQRGEGARYAPLQPLLCAAAAGNVLTCDSLLAAAAAAPPSQVDWRFTAPCSGDTVLHAAARCGRDAFIDAALLHLKSASPGRAKGSGAGEPVIHLETRNSAGCTPLLEAVLSGHVATVCGLLRAGANVGVTLPPDADELDALTLVATSCAPRGVAEALLEAGANPARRNPVTGETALDAAASLGRNDLIEAMLAAAAAAGGPAAAAALASAANPATGETALHALCTGGGDGGGAAADAPERLAAARALVAAGAVLDARTKLAGQTPLWLACFYGATELAVALAALGADPTLLDDGKNPSLRRVDALHAAAVNEAARARAPTGVDYDATCAGLAARIKSAATAARRGDMRGTA